jgi:hypothetical protein
MTTQPHIRTERSLSKTPLADSNAAPQDMRPIEDFCKYFQQYARERPEVVAIWCFGIGFVLGWKLKPW